MGKPHPAELHECVVAFLNGAITAAYALEKMRNDLAGSPDSVDHLLYILLLRPAFPSHLRFL